MLKTIMSLAALAIICCGCSKNSGSVGSASKTVQSLPGAAQPGQNTAGELRYKVPEGWTVEKPASEMRVGQYKLPRAEGDSEDATLVAYYFGQGQGGSAEANIDRWINQMQQPDGKPSKERARLETLTVNGLKVTTVDVAGTYSAEMSPGSGTFSNSGSYRLRAAVVETPKGSYYAKLVGPEKTVNRWDQAYTNYVKS